MRPARFLALTLVALSITVSLSVETAAAWAVRIVDLPVTVQRSALLAAPGMASLLASTAVGLFALLKRRKRAAQEQDDYR